MNDSAATPVAQACSVELLASDDVGPTAELLAQAFHDNPCYRFMHPRVASRAQDLTAFFARDLGWRAALHLTWVARDTEGAPIGTGTLQPPGSLLSASVKELIDHWVWPTLRQQGLHTLTRTWAAEREFSREQRLAAGQSEYWLVHAVAVRPDMQGRAIGSAIMRTLLAALRARAGSARVPLVLATQRQANLRFYARFGFRVRQQVTMGRGLRQSGYTSWFMRYEPVASTDAVLGGTNS